ncbi:unnamed protein product [Closterium sp. Yama58-4]|nr:unnamed protein product [Closterium sp. Yama58-4]
MAVLSPWRPASLPTVALLLSSIVLAVSLQVPNPAADSSLYVVQLRSAPAVAVYHGGFPGFPGTAAVRNPASQVANAAGRLFSRRPRVNLKMPHVRAFTEMLKRQQRRVARDVGIGASRLLYSYTHVANGFAAELTAGEARRMRRHPAVGSVTRSGRFRLLTTASPAFLQLPPSLWAAAGGQSSAGEDVVVGVVDTGIWPEHKSFANDSSSAAFLYGGAPEGWQGSCKKSADFPASACNGKIVGAQVFYAGFKRDSRDRMDFTKDWLSPRDADGHGTWCSGASTGNGNVQTNTLGPISGMAPRARVAMYKVFWKERGGYMYATYADIFAAVNRAVADGVDVLSLSLGGSDSSATYFDDSTFINVHAAGVVVAFAAGNAGSPWRVGMGYRTLDNFSPWYITVGASTISRFSTMTGAAVSSSSSSSSPVKPTETATSPNEAPIVAGFSSTGPLVAPLLNPESPKPTNDILKPDILAPGVSLWAATAGSSLTDTTSRYSRLSGTSMATPHIAGIAALLVQRNPEWTPAQIISAMMTTATVRNNKGTLIRNSNGDIATPWETGAGHVNPMKLLDPGLTYDANETDFRNFLAGQALTRAKKLFKGITLQSIKAYNLNRPSIAVGRLAGTVTVQRRVTNVADTASTYTAAVAGMDGVSVTVKPPSFTIEPGGGTTELVLKSNVHLTAPLPALEGFARLTITGACAVDRCIISGNNAFPIFTSPSSGSTGGILNLRNLTFQEASFESYSVTKSVSLRYFSLCIFYNNTTPTGGGGALSINSGYPQGQGPALTITGSYFRNNSAPKGQGGVIRVEGTGKVVFKSCLFDGNSAGVSGGAIYSNGTSLTIDHVSFRDNKAIGVPPTTTCGMGGVLFAVSGLYSMVYLRFCASSFSGNTGCVESVSTLYLLTVPGGSKFPASVVFCNGTSKPAGLLVPSSGWRELSSCTSR